MFYKNMELHNVFQISEDIKKDKLVMSRFPDDVRLGMVNTEIAFVCSGVEIRFKMIDDEVKLIIESLNESEIIGTIIFGCYHDSNLLILKPGVNEIVIKRPENHLRLKHVQIDSNMLFDSDIVRVLLHGGSFTPPEIVGQIESPEILKRPSKKYLAYGSSITSGGNSRLPDLTYVYGTGAKLGAESYNYGFSGSANLEACVADFIAAQKDINFLSMELGVNMIWNMEGNCWNTTELFEKRVDYFISAIAEAHKDIPVICTDVFLNCNDAFKDQTVFDFRDVVRDKAIKIERQNKNFKYVCGKDLLTEYNGLTIDQLHPSLVGMIDISENLSSVFKKMIR